jgi:hypothetical protein
LGKKYTDFLIMQLPLTSTTEKLRNFYVPESFFEYMSGIIFRKREYLVGKPIFPSSEDVGAYLYPSLLTYLKEKGVIEGNGAFFGEVTLSEKEIDLNEIKKIPIDNNVEFIYIEAKFSPPVAASQGFADARRRRGNYHHKSFVAGPLVDVKEEDVGTISFTKNGELIFYDVKKGYAYEEGKLEEILKNFVVELLS